MRRITTGPAALLLLLTATVVRAQDAIPATGQNCNITSPPTESGVAVAMHAGIFKVFPRKSDMPRDYTGCQTIWSVQFDNLGRQQEITFQRALRFYFRGGALILAHDEQRGLTCRYQDGTSAAQLANCPLLDSEHSNIPAASAPPGCLEELTKTQTVSKRCNETD